jgi:hypothetical protein
MRTPAFLFAGSLLLTSLFARPASATWPPLGRALCTAPGNQEHAKATSDGANGAIVTWQDFRSARVNIYAQGVLASGELAPGWPDNGLALLTDSTALATAFAGQASPVLVPDGQGGALVAWQDGRSVDSGLDIYAQHVLASGVVDPAWPANGRALCTAARTQNVPEIVADGAGGAIVTWMDGRNTVTNIDVYAQHVLATGAVDPDWPADGVALCTAPATQSYPRIVTDGSGGAIVTWDDLRPGATGQDIYAQHVSSAGAVDPLWPANGRALCLATGDQSNPAIVSDGVQGAIVAWADTRDGAKHVYAQRVQVSGVVMPGWPADGREVCTAALDLITPIITSDGSNGAIVSWSDLRNGTNYNPFAQHVLASGAIDAAWPVNGQALSLSPVDGVDASIVADDLGGALVVWDQDSYILLQHISASGVLDPAFPPNGRYVRFDLSFQHGADVVPSGAGAAIVAWSNDASGSDSDIYSLLLATGGTVGADPGTPGPRITFAPPSPNPAFGPVTLRFALPRAASVSLAIYDATGRHVRSLASGPKSEGAHTMAWDLRDESGITTAPGIYFVRLEVEGHVLTRKLAKPT